MFALSIFLGEKWAEGRMGVSCFAPWSGNVPILSLLLLLPKLISSHASFFITNWDPFFFQIMRSGSGCQRYRSLSAVASRLVLGL